MRCRGRWAWLLVVATTGRAELLRPEEPVVLIGASLPELVGTPPADMRVMRWHGSAFSPIPFQVDGAGPSGDLFEADESPGWFDATDELVFMIEDLGMEAPLDAWPEGASAGRYGLHVRDPREGGGDGWAYLFAGSELPVSTMDYVENPERDPFEVRTDRFSERFLAGNPGVLTEARILDGLGGDGRDLVDRVKYRAKSGPLLPWLTEDDGFVNYKGTVPIDGDIRVVLRFWVSLGNFLDMMEGTITFYRQMTMVRSTVNQLIPPSVAHMLWLADANPDIEDFRYFTDSGSGGREDQVDADGLRLVDAAGVYHEWASPTAGSVVMIQDPASIPGNSREAYYCDGCDETRWPETGDGQQWGEWGTWVKGLPFGSSFSTDAWHIWLSPADTSRGAGWVDRYAQPPRVEVVWQPLPVGVVPSPGETSDRSHLSIRPNPFNPLTRICFQDDGSVVSLAVHDHAGRRVRLLELGQPASGRRCIEWDGTDGHGRSMPTGLYQVHLRSSSGRESYPVILLK